jgi:ABC-type glutathione transport system ATPase component
MAALSGDQSTEAATDAAPLCELRDIRKEYTLRRGLIERFSRPERRVAAVDRVSLSIPRGQIFGLVGESGCGKSTLAQIMVRLIAPTSGQLLYRNADVAELSGVERREFRHGVQMVFQDTNSSLNPRKRIRRALTEALQARNATGERKGAAVRAETARLMDQVGLDTTLLGRFPHELWAASASGLASRGRLPCRPNCWLPTSRFPRSTSRCKVRSSICCRSSTGGSG